jgi:hypothetical protein
LFLQYAVVFDTGVSASAVAAADGVMAKIIFDKEN